MTQNADMGGRYPPPEMDPPHGGKWESDWELSSYWDTSMPKNSDGEPCWVRFYRESDGHEECCNHVWPVMVPISLNGSSGASDV